MKVLSTLQVRAVDGDTIRVGGERIRLRGIDTPEMSELARPGSQAAVGGVIAQWLDSHRAAWPRCLQSPPGRCVCERTECGGDSSK